jgi:23S rRNA (cytosine1962-C5)-methyltransferase
VLGVLRLETANTIGLPPTGKVPARLSKRSHSSDSLTPSGEKGKSVVQAPLFDYNGVEMKEMKTNSQPPTISLLSPDWEDYELLDSGGGLKLERFGPYALIRPEPRADWRPALPAETWKSAHAVFRPTSKNGSGQWQLLRPIDSPWIMRYKSLKFQGQVTDSRHIGVFPENAAHWDWVRDRIRTAQRPIQVLNLFAYTGLATLAAAQAGANVTHVDAAKKAIKVARENQALSGMEDYPIRWISDDALKFVRREGRRGVKYDGIIMDPPKFGRGPKGEVWEFSKLFSTLCQACRAILSERPLFIVITAYTSRTSPLSLHRTISEMMAEFGGTITTGELVTIEQSAGRVILNAIFARWVSP